MPPSTFIESSDVVIEGLLVRGTGTSEAQALALPRALLAATWGNAEFLHSIDADISEAAIVE